MRVIKYIIGLLAISILTMPLVITGCNKASAVTQEQPTLTQVIEALKNVNTYKLDENIAYTLFMGDITNPSSDSQVSIYQRQWKSQTVIDLKKGQFQLSMDERDITPGLGFSVPPISYDRYVSGGWIYDEFISPNSGLANGPLSSSTAYINEQNQIPPLVKMLESATSITSGNMVKVNNIDYSSLTFSPSKESLVDWLIAQQLSVTLQGRGISILDTRNYYLKAFQTSTITILVDKISYLIRQANIEAHFFDQKNEEFQAKMNFADFNQPVSVEVPEELVTAPPNNAPLVNTAPPTVTPSPQLIIEPPGLDFFTRQGSNPAGKEIQISAISGPLGWSLINGAPWLTISPAKGTAADMKIPVAITVDSSKLAEGTYKTAIIVQSEENGSPREVPVQLFVTTSEVNQTLDIPIKPDLGDLAAKGLTVEQTSVSTAILEKPGHNGWRTEFYNTGDPCLLVKGTFNNSSDQDLTLTYHAGGYDQDGKPVSWTLDSSLLAGIAQIDVPGHSSKEFSLHLSWAENVKLIGLMANISPSRP